MTIEIEADDDRGDISRKMGRTVGRKQLRTGTARRRRLEAGSQRRTRNWDLSLVIDEQCPTAQVDQSPDSGPKVTITGRQLDQPVGDMEPTEWDWIAQRAMAWHEDGHVLYTDHDDKQDHLDAIDSGDKGTAHSIWNALEDGAIELALTQRWSNAYDHLRLLRANLFHEHQPGVQDVERGGRVLPLAHATQAVCLVEWMDDVYSFEPEVKQKLLDPDDNDFHFYNQDDREIFVDEILPPLEAVVPKVLAEGDSEARNRLIFNFIHEVLPHIDSADADGKAQMNRDDGATQDGMPDDSRNNHSGDQQEDARELDDIDPDDIDTIVVHPGQPDESEPIADVEIPPDVEVEVADDVSSQQAEEAGATGDLLDELEEVRDSLGSPDLSSDSIEIPSENWDADEHTYQRANRKAKVFARILENRLQSERTSETKRHQNRGRFTGRGGSTRRALRGDKHVKERVVEPEEKNYHFALILDRSSSMRSGRIESAEEALGIMALALEAVGADVMIIELYKGTARLAKPFGQPVDQVKSQVFNAKTSGGTPLTGAVELTRERLLGEGENCYLTVVTDGQPNDTSSFETAIRQTTMPTLGVNITSNDEPDGMDDYDRAVAAAPGAELQQVLQGLVQEVMF